MMGQFIYFDLLTAIARYLSKGTLEYLPAVLIFLRSLAQFLASEMARSAGLLSGLWPLRASE